MTLGGDLFRRLFLRFSLSLVLALLLFVTVVHLFQQRIMDGEWREDLREQAYWLGLHTRASDAEILADAWRQTHDTVRLTIYDADGRLLADSHPERSPLALDDLRQQRTKGTLAAVQPMRNSGFVAISRAQVPTLANGLHWGLVAAALAIGGAVVVLLRPFVSSMSSTLGKLTEIAREAASGHFGKTLAVEGPDELGTLVLAINDMSRKLEEAARLNTRLLHDVSHELRSPLGRIQVMAQTIALRPEETADCIHGINQEIALLDRLVGDLLETARFEAGSTSLRPERFSLEQWSQETFSRLESRARSSQIEWHTTVPEHDVEVDGDPQRLAQAVGNLVDNAITALDGRTSGRIDITLETEQDRWSLSVEDNGPGIPPHDLPHVFRRFYRAGIHRDRDQGGVGLGLSLVGAIVEAHGGEVSLESKVGEGTRVVLSLGAASGSARLPESPVREQPPARPIPAEIETSSTELALGSRRALAASKDRR